MTRRHVLIALAVAAAVLLVVLVAVRPGSQASRPAPTTTDPRGAMLFEGDRPNKPATATVSKECASYAAPLRKLVADHDYFVDLDLTQAQQWLDLTAELHQACRDADGTAIRAELDTWRALIPPTYTVDEYVTLSEQCAEALAPTRRTLAGLSRAGAAAPSFSEVTQAAATAMSASCTPAEAALFQAGEIDPPLRRAGVLPSSQNATPQTTVPATPAVRVPTERAQLSEPCAAALAPARQILTDAKDKSASAPLREEFSRAVSSAVPTCAPAEIEEFNRLEASPALGLTPLSGG